MFIANLPLYFFFFLNRAIFFTDQHKLAKAETSLALPREICL